MRWLIRERRRLGVEALTVGIPVAAVLFAYQEPGFALWSGLAASLLLPVRLRWPRIAVLLCVPALAGGLGWAPAIVALFALGRAQPRFWPLTSWGAVVALSAVLPVLVLQSLGVGAIVLTISFVVLAAGAPAALGALVALRQQLAVSLCRLREAVDAQLRARAETARAEERARIAREIHDAVGHHVTLIAVESAALAATTGEAESKDTALRVRELARQALDEMRVTLGLGDGRSEQPGLRTIPDLVGRARDAGVDVELSTEVTGEPAASVQRAAYRVVQEALTNASKHAPGAPVRVRLDDGDGELRVSVINGASGDVVPEASGGGSGLEGLSERVRMAGGRLHAGRADDGGFELVAVLPGVAAP